MQKLRGTERRSVYPISLFFRRMKPVPLKELFRGMVYKDIIPHYDNTPTLEVSKTSKMIESGVCVKDRPSSLNAQSEEWWSVFKPSQIIYGIDSQKINPNLGGKTTLVYNKKNIYKNKFESFKGDVRDLPSSIFSRALDIIVMGVCRNLFYYVLPEGQGEISMKNVSNRYTGRRLFKELMLNPEQTNHSIFAPCLSFYSNKKDRFSISKSVYLRTSKHYNNTLRRLMFTAYKHKFATTNVLTNAQLVYLLKRFYWDVPKDLIRRVLSYGFKKYRLFSQYNIAVISRRPKLGKSVAVSYALITTHSRFYNSYHRPDLKDARQLASRLYKRKAWKFYNGYYYVSLTNREFINLKDYILLNKKHHFLMEHAMLDPERKPHIVAIKVPKPLYYKESFRKNIDYEKNDIKHIWSWDGSRFRTFNHA